MKKRIIPDESEEDDSPTKGGAVFKKFTHNATKLNII